LTEKKEIAKFLHSKNKAIWALHPGHKWPGFTAQMIKGLDHNLLTKKVKQKI
jgi:hypothetical protein